jgi:fructose-bisphosphate aldolase class I
MDEQKLIETAKKVAGDKGLLAMDESNPTCDERFAKWGIPQTVEARRAYREMIVTTPGLGAAMDKDMSARTNIPQVAKPAA